MDLSEAYGNKFVAKADKTPHTRIKNLEPEPKPTPAPIEQGTSLLPTDVNPRPSSAPRVKKIDRTPRPRHLAWVRENLSVKLLEIR